MAVIDKEQNPSTNVDLETLRKITNIYIYLDIHWKVSYGNLDLLANQKQACDQIDKMLGAFFSILKPYLTEYQPDTNPKL